MSEYDHESSIMRMPWPTGGLLPHKTRKYFTSADSKPSNISFFSHIRDDFEILMSVSLRDVIFKETDDSSSTTL